MSQSIQSCFERYEKKYFLTPAGQKALLQTIAPYIKMDFYGKYTICNLYYDTPDWRLIRASLEKPVYKEKLRLRSYGVPAPDGKVFAELKKKYKGVVYKRRITVPAAEVQPLLAGQRPLADYGQIGREIAWFQQLYDAHPRVFIGYDRIAFAGVAASAWSCCKKACAAGGSCAILGAEMQKGGMRSAAADRRGRRGPCRGAERLF